MSSTISCFLRKKGSCCILKLNEIFSFIVTMYEKSKSIISKHVIMLHTYRIVSRWTAWNYKARMSSNPHAIWWNLNPFYHAHSIIVHQYDLLRHWGSNNLVYRFSAFIIFIFGFITTKYKKFIPYKGNRLKLNKNEIKFFSHISSYLLLLFKTNCRVEMKCLRQCWFESCFDLLKGFNHTQHLWKNNFHDLYRNYYIMLEIFMYIQRAVLLCRFDKIICLENHSIVWN